MSELFEEPLPVTTQSLPPGSVKMLFESPLPVVIVGDQPGGGDYTEEIAAIQQVLERSGANRKVEWVYDAVAEQWPEKPTIEPGQYRHADSVHAIDAPEPDLSVGDRWDAHPHSPIYATL